MSHKHFYCSSSDILCQSKSWLLYKTCLLGGTAVHHFPEVESSNSVHGPSLELQCLIKLLLASLMISGEILSFVSWVLSSLDLLLIKRGKLSCSWSILNLQQGFLFSLWPLHFCVCCLRLSSHLYFSCLSFLGGSGVKASACNARDLGSIPRSGRSPGEGNGNPLQYSCLENPMDGGAWWAKVHGVAKSWTQLSDFTHFIHSLRPS